MLPHRFPFLLVDERAGGGGVTVRLTGNAAHLRGQAASSESLAVEIMAQAARLLLPAAVDGDLLLAGIDDARFSTPLRPGDSCAARAAVVARWGDIVKVEAELAREGETVAAAGLLLASVPK